MGHRRCSPWLRHAWGGYSGSKAAVERTVSLVYPAECLTGERGCRRKIRRRTQMDLAVVHKDQLVPPVV